MQQGSSGEQAERPAQWAEGALVRGGHIKTAARAGALLIVGLLRPQVTAVVVKVRPGDGLNDRLSLGWVVA
jgi:hypothetical protein